MLLVQGLACSLTNCFVSIHYMLLVQKQMLLLKIKTFRVSIHYMLLVQKCVYKLLIKTYNISIHYMLLVQMLDELFQRNITTLFQYIICCWFKYLFFPHSFPHLFQYIICCWFKRSNRRIQTRRNVSIHYMLLVQLIATF